MTNALRSTQDEGVTTLTLNRPQVLNAVDEDLGRALLQELRQAAGDKTTRVVVLEGAGDSFCAGADLKEAKSQGEAARLRWMRTVAEIVRALSGLPQPVVAKVHGHALGLGATLALACDLVVCATDASFGYPEVEHGLAPGLSLAVLSTLTNVRVMADLVLTGRRVSGEEAVRLGLATRSVSAARLDAELAEMTSQLQSKSSTALRLSKTLLRDLAGMPADERLSAGLEVVKIARMGADATSRLDSFAQRTASSGRDGR